MVDTTVTLPNYRTLTFYGGRYNIWLIISTILQLKRKLLSEIDRNTAKY